MENLLNISIITDDKSGLAQIMSGYLNYYSNKKINVSVKGKTKIIHPLAEQVLREDGIDVIENSPTAQKDDPDLFIFINIEPLEGESKHINHRNYNFNNPLQHVSYDIILDAYRLIREEIKKECILLIGELHLA